MKVVRGEVTSGQKSGGRSSVQSNSAVPRKAALAAIVFGGLGIAAAVFGLPGWLAASLVGLGPLIAAVWVFMPLRRQQERWADPSPRPASDRPPTASPARMVEAEVVTDVSPRRAIGYLLLEPGDDPFARRSHEVRLWCDARKLELESVVHDTEAPGEQRARPSLQWALAQIAGGEADTLVVTRLVDLSPSVSTLSPLLRWFTGVGRALVAIDFKTDTATPAGQLAADAVAGVGNWERERMSARTRRGLDAARSRGEGLSRAAVADVPTLNDRISRMRDGMTLQAIADVLNAEGVPTLRGGAMWRPSSVQRAAGYRRPSAVNGGIELPRAHVTEARRRA